MWVLVFRESMALGPRPMLICTFLCPCCPLLLSWVPGPGAVAGPVRVPCAGLLSEWTEPPSLASAIQ